MQLWPDRPAYRGIPVARGTVVISVFTAAPESLDALERACRIAADAHARLIIALVVPPATLEAANAGLAPINPSAAVGASERAISAEAETALRVAARYRHRPEIVHVIDADAVVELAERRQASLIVVGIHRAGFLERLFAGDPSGAVARLAGCDVLVVHTDLERVQSRAARQPAAGG